VTTERDLFPGFGRMRRDIDELFGDVFERSGLRGRGFVPAVDVLYLDDPPRAVVRADLAGVDPERLALEIRGRQLIIAGERRTVESGARVYQQLEIEQGVFRRAVELGADVVADDASASYDDGILRVEVPLVRRELKSRRVPIEEPRS
jgi:HSP20 family protein